LNQQSEINNQKSTLALRHRIRPLRARLLLLLAVLGPGIITANVDNDAGGITTYSVAGAHYGYSLLWIMPLLALALIIVQEMSARLGVVTGKGLADLIRESLGVRLTAIIIGIMLIANLANTVSEFAGVAASVEIFGISKYISVPVAAVLVWLLIVKANYKFVERVFLVASLVFIAYIISGHPVECGLLDDGRHHHRHHHRPVDAVLSAGVDRGQGLEDHRLRL
jgi:NRAMP (natural resistance-associated macrophage protein)-like metal ion transporter